jgi:CBS domain containing-hemolysin-like protein
MPKTMTDKIDTSDDPSSITAPKPGAQLHLVSNEPDTKPQGLSLTGFLKGLISGRSETTLHEALKEFVDEDDTTPLTPEERHLIANILNLRRMRAVDVMIPRADIVAIDSSISNDELFTLLSEKQFSRFPVYRETLDDVIGSIHIKDVLAALARRQEIRIESLVRDVPIVSPAMPVIDLILEMKETRRHMALVVDEFGGIDGLVTVGDIIEAIVGEIEDEHEIDDEPQLIQMADGTILADGRVDIDTFEERFGTILTDEDRGDIDTLAGLVFSIAGRVPSRGEVISHEDSGLVLEIIDADPRRVHRLRIKNIPKEQQAE